MEYNENLHKSHRPVYCWGHKRVRFPEHKGVVTYALSPNRQRPMAHAYYNAVFNTFRRSRNQFLYVVPPFVAAYFVLDWAEKKNKFYNTKAGRMMEAEEAGAG